jgi:hypothetical protein
MGSNLDRFFNPLTGRVDKDGRNPVAFEGDAWGVHHRLTSRLRFFVPSLDTSVNHT